MEAGASGASVAGSTVVAVVVNFIAFLGLLAFINATLSWFGGRVGYPELSFEVNKHQMEGRLSKRDRDGGRF